MKVFFTASRWGKEKYQKEYDMVREAIKKLNVELISPEEDNYHTVLTQEERKQFPDSEALRHNWLWHYEAIRRGIAWADAVILEVSSQDFQLGHEATLAIMEKKPVLCLSVHEDYGKKIHNDFFFGAKYTQSTIREIIQDFLAKARELSLSKRFNMFLYPSQIAFIQKAGKAQNMNMSEYIRHLINLDRKTSQG